LRVRVSKHCGYPIYHPFVVLPSAFLAWISSGITKLYFLSKAIFVAPILKVKIRLQTESMHKENYRPSGGVLTAVKTIYKEEGLLSFYAGFKGVVANSFQSGLYFSFCEILERFFISKFSNDYSKLLSTFCASVVANIVSVALMYPNDNIVSRLQYQNLQNKVYDGYKDCAIKVFQKEGFSGFYKGCAASLIRSTISITAWMMTYKFMRNTLS
jgi:solute carrier family 25 folate transporter 32